MNENDKRFIARQDFSDSAKSGDEKFTFEVGISRYLIDVEWDGGTYSKVTPIREYFIRDKAGIQHFYWRLDNEILEYLCGKLPVDEMDKIILKKNIVVPNMVFFDESPLKETYYKNLKINKIKRVTELIKR